MIKNYLLLAFKNLRKQKLFSLINILGLTVGITCCLLIFLFIKHELSYDDFHKNGKNIYRVVRTKDVIGSSDKQDISWLSGPYSIALRNDYPDMIKKAVRVMPDNDLFSYNNNSFNEKHVYITDSDFFQLFDFPLIKGNPATALKDPSSIVLTVSTAKKYFGNEDPMGKVLQMNRKMQLRVTGIAKDVPTNSQLDFDMIVPISNFKRYDSLGYFPFNGLYVYVQLNPKTDPQQLVSLFPGFMDKYMGKYYSQNGFKMGLDLQPLRKIYLKPNQKDTLKHGNKKVIYIFMSIAFLILIIASINFMNLSTAKATDRSKEVGIRKVLGALRKQLFTQFIFESFLYVGISSFLSLILLQLLMPAYSNLLGYELPVFWKDLGFYIFLLLLIIIVGFFAGIYPASLLSSFSVIESLKGKFRVGLKGAFFRKALVVFQFSISVLLIISITIIISQMNFVKNTELGFNKDQTLLIRLDNHDIYKARTLFKNTVKMDPSVIDVSLMSGEPGGFFDGNGMVTEAMPDQKLLFNTQITDFDCIKTLGLKIISGRDLSSQYSTDSANAALINRSAATKLGYTPEQAIGKWIRNVTRDSSRRVIVGVVEDYHFTSLRQKIEPLLISPGNDHRVAAIRLIPSANLKSTINKIRNVYTTIAPGYPFEYEFLDEDFNRLYKDDIKQGVILSIFSAIAIIIACLGLFGLASYTAVKRTKEIGIRKVLGSSVKNIVILLSKDLLKPVMLGTVIAIPLSYYIMLKWLQGFAYRIQIHWWMFAGAAMIAIIIALLTVSFQTIKAAVANPVKNLRTE